MSDPVIGPWQLRYENPYLRVYSVLANFGSFNKEYFVSDTGTRAGMLACKGDQVLLVRQYRLLINRLGWEIPGGRVDGGEDPLNAAVRECLEESGVECINPKPLIAFQQGLDTQLCPTHLFYCDEVRERVHLANPREVKSVEWVTIPRAIEMIQEQSIVDSFSIVGLLALSKFAAGFTNR